MSKHEHAASGNGQATAAAKPLTATRAGLSVVMIVRNEQKFLRGCLTSIRHIADEIVILDTGSSDRTVEIALSLGAQVHHLDWPGDFSVARNAALEHAHQPWVLQLDADERPDEQSVRALRGLLVTPPTEPFAYLVTVRNLASFESNRTNDLTLQPRLFARHPSVGYVRPIHEQLVDMRTGQLPRCVAAPQIGINHYGYITAIMRERGKLERNVEALRAAVQADPSEAANHFDLGRLLLSAGEDGVALACLIQAIRAFEASPRRPDVGAMAHSLAALACVRLGRAEEGVMLAGRGLQLRQSAHGLLVLGKARLAAGIAADAIESLLQALDAVERDGEEAVGFSVTVREVLAALAQALHAQGRLTEALDCCRRMPDASTPSAEWHYLVGDLNMRLGRTDEGVCHLMECCRLLESGSRRQADPDIAFATDRATTQAMAHIMLSQAAFSRKRAAKAVEQAGLAVAVAPGFRPATLQLALSLRAAGRPRRAATVYGSLVERQPDDVEALVGMASALTDAGDATAAVSLLSSAIDRHHSAVYQALGVALARLGQYQDSAAAFELADRTLTVGAAF